MRPSIPKTATCPRCAFCHNFIWQSDITKLWYHFSGVDSCWMAGGKATPTLDFNKVENPQLKRYLIARAIEMVQKKLDRGELEQG